jgi:hypothetical protein
MNQYRQGADVRFQQHEFLTRNLHERASFLHHKETSPRDEEQDHTNLT